MSWNMLEGKITFDRFIRLLAALLLLGAGIWLIDYLSPVLIPFFVAWLMAYLLYPMVHFLQYKCRLRWRFPCIVLTLLLVGGVLTGLAFLTVPPLVEESAHLKDVALEYVQKGARNTTIPAEVQQFFRRHEQQLRLQSLLGQEDVYNALREMLPKAWDVLRGTLGWIVGVISSLIALLYFFFLLMDYEFYSRGYLRFVPARRREFVQGLVHDVAHSMNGYLRGQALVALSNCVMFSLGFWLIGMPVPVALGCFIGVISFVPYVQVIGIVPCSILALLRAVETNENFWLLLGLVLLVYIVVQILQDTIFTPRIMGGIMGLPAAVVLLSLSVWGYALGIIGLIIALPLTTLLLTYYKKYVVKESL